ncbi:hypothetical protein K402DRAFT_169855 [Aulographum hederae CBS 113979]|uniref:Uncharacterized protein n=1 Tax=Aulographum hederae CBS 113979 TaxID=1176131 RepID=A0A6G1HCT0_9PEZI|nr:hypothetical protein K402DRAFT_169855 [Aulographum hederae CBS 113979]
MGHGIMYANIHHPLALLSSGSILPPPPQSEATHPLKHTEFSSLYITGVGNILFHFVYDQKDIWEARNTAHWEKKFSLSLFATLHVGETGRLLCASHTLAPQSPRELILQPHLTFETSLAGSPVGLGKWPQARQTLCRCTIVSFVLVLGGQHHKDNPAVGKVLGWGCNLVSRETFSQAHFAAGETVQSFLESLFIIFEQYRFPS